MRCVGSAAVHAAISSSDPVRAAHGRASQTHSGPEQAWNGAADASLLLFVRADSRAAYAGQDQLATLMLRSLDGQTLSRFEGDAKRGDTGWSAYSARLSQGMLILEDRGELPRQIPSYKWSVKASSLIVRAEGSWQALPKADGRD